MWGNNMKILELPRDERPREKLLARGAGALTDAELLAIFLRTGIPGKSAIDLARDLIAELDGLHGLFSADQKRFCKIKGLGPAKYVQLQAVLEMTRRYLAAEMSRGDPLTNPEATRALSRPSFTTIPTKSSPASSSIIATRC
jgi:DNA repair protein RadC